MFVERKSVATNKGRVLRLHVSLQRVFPLRGEGAALNSALVVLLARVRVDVHLQVARVAARKRTPLEGALVRLLARVRHHMRRQRPLRPRRVLAALLRTLERPLVRVHAHVRADVRQRGAGVLAARHGALEGPLGGVRELVGLEGAFGLGAKEQPSTSHLKGRSVVWERRWTLRDCLTRVE